MIMKYSVWTIKGKTTYFATKYEASKYLNSLKIEAYLNIYPLTDKEDCILGNGKYKEDN